MTEPRASVIIPVHNRHAELEALLGQLDQQTCPQFEVVLVDDGSEPPADECVDPSAHPYPIQLVRLPQRGGIARARNRGIAHAGGAIVVFLDSDSIVSDPRWLEKHLAAHAHPRDLPGAPADNLYVVNSKVVGLHTTYAGYADGYSNWFVSCGNAPCEVRDHHVPMNNTSMPRRVFDAVGLFDEQFEVAEDIDWSFRCLRHGVKLIYFPDMPVSHLDPPSFRALWAHYKRFGQYALLVRKKNPGSPFRYLFPWNRLTGWLYFLPLTTLMTLYILARWLPRDPRVLFYLPGLVVANVAYNCGILEYLRKPDPVRK